MTVFLKSDLLIISSSACFTAHSEHHKYIHAKSYTERSVCYLRLIIASERIIVRKIIFVINALLLLLC